MSTKKQRKELEDRLHDWIFDALKEEWDTETILSRAGKEWSEVVGETSRGVDYKGLAEWQGKILALTGVGTNTEVAAQAMTEAIDAVQEVFDEYPVGSITRAVGSEVVEKLLTETEAGAGVEVIVDADAYADVSASSAEKSFVGKLFGGRKKVLRNAGGLAVAGVMCLGLGVASPIASSSQAYALSNSYSNSSNTSFAGVEPQSMTVASSVSEVVVRENVTVEASVTVIPAGGAVAVATPVGGSGNGSLVASAMKYIGMHWDCTYLVEQALRDMGHSVGDLAPMDFGGYGTVFYDASAVQAGDIMMRPGHVAIYAGDGMTVQGGYGFGGVVYNSWEGPASYTAFVRVG